MVQIVGWVQQAVEHIVAPAKAAEHIVAPAKAGVHIEVWAQVAVYIAVGEWTAYIEWVEELLVEQGQPGRSSPRN